MGKKRNQRLSALMAVDQSLGKGVAAESCSIRKRGVPFWRNRRLETQPYGACYPLSHSALWDWDFWYI